MPKSACTIEPQERDALKERLQSLPLKAQRYAAARTMGLGKRMSRAVAGYSPSSGDTRENGLQRTLIQSIEAERSDLRARKGFRLTDAAGRYNRIANKQEKGNPFAAIAAQSRLDKLLGLEAPQEINVTDTRDMHKALLAVASLGLSACEIVSQLSSNQQAQEQSACNVNDIQGCAVDASWQTSETGAESRADGANAAAVQKARHRGGARGRGKARV